MKAAIFSFSQQGTQLGRRVSIYLQEQGWQSVQTTLKKYCRSADVHPFTPDLHAQAERSFTECRLLVFIGACGIAVRTIAPFIRHKDVDPAVLVLDEGGHFVIPILSGHLGGANDLARAIAGFLQAQPVVTTATDVHGLVAIDEWAKKHALRLSSLTAAKTFAATLLAKGRAGFYSEFPVQGTLPPGLAKVAPEKAVAALTIHNKTVFPQALVLLHPPILHLGIGCRRKISEVKIIQHITRTLQTYQLSWQSLCDIHSIDVKAQEEGLLQAAEKLGLPLHFHTAAALNNVPGKFNGSAFVKQTVGTDNVCERAAMLASHGGRLLVGKTAQDGVTLAIARENYQLIL